MDKSFVSHPGAGTVRTLDGSILTTIQGAQVAWKEQQYDPLVNQQAFFQNIIVPQNVDITDNLTLRIVFRQVDAGVGNVIFEVLSKALDHTSPVNRDVALVSQGITPATAVPGIGLEKAVTLTVSQAGFTAGEEFQIAVRRRGGDAGDNFGGKVAVVRFDADFVAVDPASKWSDGSVPGTIYYGGGNVGIGVNPPLQALDVSGGIRIGTTGTALAGSIRYTGGDFWGYDGAIWKSFTASGGGGEVNTASNRVSDTASRKGVFYQKLGVDLQFKVIQAGSNITLATDTNTITINGPTPGETNTASNRLGDTGTQKGVFSTKSGVDLQFKVIKAGTNVILGADADSVTINATGAGGGEANTASNRLADSGTQKGWFYQKNGVDLEFKVVKAGTNITLSSDNDSVTINASGGGGGSLDDAYNVGSTITVDTGSVTLTSSILTALQINQNTAGRGVRINSSTSGADGFYADITTGDAFYGVVTTGRGLAVYTSGGTARTQPLSRYWYNSGTYNSNTGVRAIHIDCATMTPNPSTQTGAIYLSGSTSSNAFYSGVYYDGNWDYGWYSDSPCWMAADKALYFGGTDVAVNRQGGRIWLGQAFSPDAFIFDTPDRTSTGATDQIIIETGNASDGNSGAITIQTGTASSTRGNLSMTGGAVSLTASTGAASITAPASSSWTVTGVSQILAAGTTGLGSYAIFRNAGAKSGSIGQVRVDTGTQVASNTGDAFFETGEITGGDTSRVTGNITMRSGRCWEGDSGFVNIESGDTQSTTRNSGNVIISSGDCTWANSTGNSGLLGLYTGAVERGTSGAIYLQTGTPAPDSSTGNSGSISIKTANIAGTTNGNTGSITLETGQVPGNGNTGNITLNTQAVVGSGTRGYIGVSGEEVFLRGGTNDRITLGASGVSSLRIGHGTSNPTGASGWDPGSLFINTSGTPTLYINTGTVGSAVWTAV